MKVLWLTAGLNHYKARFLNHLASTGEIDLSVLTGTGRGNVFGDRELEENWNFSWIKLAVSKKKFGNSSIVRKKLNSFFKHYDWILIPAEKKNLPLFVFATWLRFKNPEVKLFSYNHPVLKSGNGKVRTTDILLTKLFYRFLDRVIFYTEESCRWAVKNEFINNEKAFWANNTIDTSEIKKHYSFVSPPTAETSILFIGRLIPSKRLDILLKYFSELQKIFLSINRSLKLEVIGDGPQRSILSKLDLEECGIIWHGALIEELKIAPVMQRASVVFIPGHSGLSINHAFAYGRPYITLESPDHAPEINYLEDGKNGMILRGSHKENVNTLKHFLLNRDELEKYCHEAAKTGEYLSVEKWTEQMKNALLDE